MFTKILQCTQSDLSLQCVAATCCCNKSPDLYTEWSVAVSCCNNLSPGVFVEKGHLDGCRVNHYPFWISEWHPRQSPSLPHPPPPHPCPSPSLQRILSRIGDMISPSALWLLRLQNSPVQALYMAKTSCLEKPILRGKRLFCSLMTAALTLQQMYYFHFSHTCTNLYKLED